MNAETRNTLQGIKSRLNDIAAEIETIRDDEQEKFDNMPEGLQQGDTGQRIDQAITALTDAFDSVDGSASHIDDAISA